MASSKTILGTGLITLLLAAGTVAYVCGRGKQQVPVVNPVIQKATGQPETTAALGRPQREIVPSATEQPAATSDLPDITVRITDGRPVTQATLYAPDGNSLEAKIAGNEASFVDVASAPYRLLLASGAAAVEDSIPVFDNDVRREYHLSTWPTLPRTFPGSGIVQDKLTGHPISGAKITFAHEDDELAGFSYVLTSGLDGTFSGDFAAMPYLVATVADDYVPSLRRNVEVDEVRPLVLTLQEGAALTGKVISDNAPVAGAKVYLLDPIYFRSLAHPQSKTNTEGMFNLKGIGPMRDELFFTSATRNLIPIAVKDGYHQPNFGSVIPSAVSFGRTIDDVFYPVDGEVVIELASNNSSLEGIVTDVEGNPSVASLTLSPFTNSPFEREYSLTTNEDGAFYFGKRDKLPPGEYLLTVFPPDDLVSYVETRKRVVLEEYQSLEVMLNQGMFITGSAHEQDSVRPVPYATVTFTLPSQPPAMVTAQADEAGKFETYIPRFLTPSGKVIPYTAQHGEREAKGTLFPMPDAHVDVSFLREEQYQTYPLQVVDAATGRPIQAYRVEYGNMTTGGVAQGFHREGLLDLRLSKPPSPLEFSAVGYHPAYTPLPPKAGELLVVPLERKN